MLSYLYLWERRMKRSCDIDVAGVRSASQLCCVTLILINKTILLLSRALFLLVLSFSSTLRSESQSHTDMARVAIIHITVTVD